MGIYQILLRVVHYGSSLIWIGATLFLVAFLTPTVDLNRPEGQAFWRRLRQRVYCTGVMGWASIVSVISSLLLYAGHSELFRSSWMLTPAGVTLGIGGLAGLAAGVVAAAIALPTCRRLKAMAATIADPEGAIDPALLHEAGQLHERLGNGVLWNVALLTVAVVCMVIAAGPHP